jgi:hypothetical protein
VLVDSERLGSQKLGKERVDARVEVGAGGSAAASAVLATSILRLTARLEWTDGMDGAGRESLKPLRM